jgi:hypothetical protein
MFVENVPTIVNVKALKGRFIPHKFFTGCGDGCGKEKEFCWPVCNQV